MADESPLPLTRICLYSVERSARVSTVRARHKSLTLSLSPWNIDTIVPIRHPDPSSLLPSRRHKYPGDRHRNSGKTRTGTRYRRRTRTHHLPATSRYSLPRLNSSCCSLAFFFSFYLPVQDLCNRSGLFQPVVIRSSHTLPHFHPQKIYAGRLYDGGSVPSLVSYH